MHEKPQWCITIPIAEDARLLAHVATVRPASHYIRPFLVPSAIPADSAGMTIRNLQQPHYLAYACKPKWNPEYYVFRFEGILCSGIASRLVSRRFLSSMPSAEQVWRNLENAVGLFQKHIGALPQHSNISCMPTAPT